MNNDFMERATLVANVLRTTLEECNLYIALDSATEEFVFIDRTEYENNKKGKVARVKMTEINVK